MNSFFAWLSLLFFSSPFSQSESVGAPELPTYEETSPTDDIEKDTHSNDDEDSDSVFRRYIFNPISNGF